MREWYAGFMPHHLLILTRETREYAKRIRAMGLQGCEIYAPETEEGIRAALSNATIVFGSPPLLRNFIADIPNLQWVQSDFVGVDALMGEGMRRDYLLTNVKDVYGQVMAEYVLGYILYFHRRIGEFRNHQAQFHWKSEPQTTLEGITVGILGTGSIGRAIAETLRTFGMHIIGMSRTGADVDGFDDVCATDRPEDFFPKVDYMISILPKTTVTDGILNTRTLALMKNSAVLINIGRGNAVEEDDLADALRNGIIRAAVLDVFREEPLPQHHPFWVLPNCIVTPHVSGFMTSDRVFSIFQDNYQRFLAGEELLYRVDFTKGY